MLQTALRIDEELYALRGGVEATRIDLYGTLYYLIEATRHHQSAEASRPYVERMIEVLRTHANDPEVAPGERLEYAVYLLEAEPEDLRNPHEAKRVAQAVVEELRGGDARSLLVLASAHRALGKEEKAHANLERELEVAPVEDEELLSAINHYLASGDVKR